ncbi:MAG TPA: dihydroorotase [Thermoplasmata archaeon]
MRVLRGRIFYRGRLEPLSLGIDEDGRIAAIKRVLRGDEEIDHGEAVILPGCVDLHVHMRDPGLTHKEDFPSGTRSAAIGGVTTVADMPNTRPAVTRHRILEDKISVLRGRACVDYALYAAPQEAGVVSSLADAAAFKIYLAESTGGLQIKPEAVPDVVDAAGREQKLVVVHAEDPSLLAKDPGRDLRGHSTARPKEAEQKAISSLAPVAGSARVHVAHVTCVEALDAALPGVTTEVTPHHLFLDWRRPLGARGKVNPPLRSPEDRKALWEAFRAGRGDIVASDHAPHALEEKEGPFDEAPAGVPGVGSAFPLLMRRTRAGDIELQRLVSATATRPAELLGVRKGSIEIGSDADLLAVDPRRVERITAKRLRARCDWTPFEGMEGCFPLAVYLRGEPIVEQGEPVADGRGRLLPSSA